MLVGHTLIPSFWGQNHMVTWSNSLFPSPAPLGMFRLMKSCVWPTSCLKQPQIPDTCNPWRKTATSQCCSWMCWSIFFKQIPKQMIDFILPVRLFFSAVRHVSKYLVKMGFVLFHYLSNWAKLDCFHHSLVYSLLLLTGLVSLCTAAYSFKGVGEWVDGVSESLWDLIILTSKPKQ